MPTVTSSKATSASGSGVTPAANQAQPLGTSFPITNSDGTPTAYMTRWAQQRQMDISNGVTLDQVNALIAALKVTGNAPIVVAGTLATGLTISLQDSGVTAGSYTSADITVDAFGRVIMAADGSGGGGQVVGSDTGPVGFEELGGHRYWRLNNILEAAGSSNINSCLIGELRFYDSAGSNLTYTSPQASSVLSSNPAYQVTNINDGNPASIYAAANPTAGPTWVSVDFGSIVSPAKIGLIIAGDSSWPSQMPRTFDWEYSDDRSTWTPLQTGVTFAAYSFNVEQQQPVTQAPVTPSQVYPQKLRALNDVSKTSPTDGQVLTWVAATSLWTPEASGGGGGSKAVLNVSFSGSQSIGSSFNKINLNTVNTDTASGWDNTNYQYTIPTTGTYLVVAKARVSDGAGTFSYGLGVGTSAGDSPDFFWGTTVSGGGNQRNGMLNTLIKAYTAGQVIYPFMYADSGSSIQAASLNIAQLI